MIHRTLLYFQKLRVLQEEKSGVNSIGYLHLGGNIRNIYILLLSALSFGGTVTDIDGNVYEIVPIGDQVWMAENLKVTHYNDGSEIPTGYTDEEWGELETGAFAVYPIDYDEASQTTCGNDCSDVYGNLYNWFAVDDSRGLCMEGWHVQSQLK